MRSIVLALWLIGACAAAQSAAAAEPATGLPTGKGLPVVVRAAVAFVEVAGFDENAGTFDATVDIRLRWQDTRLRRPAAEAMDPPQVFRGADAEEQIGRMWTPKASLVNQVGEATQFEQGLRIEPSGWVELLQRVRGTFGTPFEVGHFPFDRQKLQIEVALRGSTVDSAVLEFRQDDIDFSRAAANAELDGWTLGIVDLRGEPISGWYGATHARIRAALEIERHPAQVVAPVFIPLFASLLIPLLAIWLNRIVDGKFEVESFELVNIIIGGLFAVIALNFTVNAEYSFLSSGDNPVTRLFALNYVTLGASLLVNILLYRFSVVERMFGRYVQEQTYACLVWAIPVIALTLACSVVFVAVV